MSDTITEARAAAEVARSFADTAEDPTMREVFDRLAKALDDTCNELCRAESRARVAQYAERTRAMAVRQAVKVLAESIERTLPP